MIARLMICAWCAVVLCFGSFASGQSNNRLEITLEGPWILYADSAFANGIPVLIAMSPAVADDSDPNAFHFISINTGDGYYIKHPNVYCLTFGTVCGLKGAPALIFDGYPEDSLPLPVKVPTGWDWTSLSEPPNLATLIILPMPNSISTDGAWPMRFGSKFDPAGNGYKTIVSERHSIGVQLHYDIGPASFNLLACSGHTIDTCKYPAPIEHTALNNTGTLRITMKSPDVDDACDPHVRAAYPRMLALVGASTNTDKAVIDLARSVDSAGKPSYADSSSYNCLQHDPQNPINNGGKGQNAGHSMKISPSISSQINEIVKLLTQINDDPDVTTDQKKTLLLPQLPSDITIAMQGLDDDFPRISQLSLLQTLVRLSQRNVDKVLIQINAEASQSIRPTGRLHPPLHSAVPVKREQALLGLLVNVKEREESFVDAPPSKGGNDCRAAVMLVQ